MNKYQLSESQYDLIRRGLERLYYNYKDEGDVEAMIEVTELEKSLIKQDEEHKESHEEMLNIIHRCYSDIMEEDPDKDKVEEIGVEIKKELQYEADQWGWDDTEVRDRIWDWINKNIKHG